VLFSAVVFFQLINHPVEIKSSTPAKQQLEGMGNVS
jgi:Zn-dependent membrane protease YugP